MSYRADVLEVMIASPSDVAEERQIIRQVIYDWNVVHARSREAVLLPRSWETHSTPTFGKSPQEVINQDVLTSADLLVGVFWTRLGTTTESYASGTVEEIERHVGAGKPAMLYFSNRAVSPGRLDHEQYAALQQFRKSCDKRALYDTYDSSEDFKAKFARQLALQVEKLLPAVDTGGVVGSVARLTSHALPPRPQNLDESLISMLSPPAKSLLTEAAKTSTGEIHRHDLDQALVIQVNRQQFEARSDNGRYRAELEGALDELQEQGLISDVMGKRTLFQLTTKGYRIAGQVSETA